MPVAVISIDDPHAADVRELLARHLEFARSQTPPEGVYALDADDLAEPAVTFFSYRLDGHLLAVGALKRLSARHAEIKSMHTAAAAPDEHLYDAGAGPGPLNPATGPAAAS